MSANDPKRTWIREFAVMHTSNSSRLSAGQLHGFVWNQCVPCEIKARGPGGIAKSGLPKICGSLVKIDRRAVLGNAMRPAMQTGVALTRKTRTHGPRCSIADMMMTRMAHRSLRVRLSELSA
jgi:hypothetical protein